MELKLLSTKNEKLGKMLKRIACFFLLEMDQKNTKMA